MGTEAVSDLAIHPGSYLRDELEAHGLSQTQLAERIRRPARTINVICRERHGISARMALDLEAVLDLSASTWLGLQAEYDLTRERQRRASA